MPLIFERYADDLALRTARLAPRSVLEIAAGTGVVTRALASGLDASVEITASDVNPDMIEHAEALGTSRPVAWRQADVIHLPFPDNSFDVVVCQFSAMFFPNRPTAYAEINRVLRAEGTFVFSVWDEIANNEFAAVVTEAVGELFPGDPPLFLARTPHGYHDDSLGSRRSGVHRAGHSRGARTPEQRQHRRFTRNRILPGTSFAERTRTARPDPAQRGNGTCDETSDVSIRLDGPRQQDPRLRDHCGRTIGRKLAGIAAGGNIHSGEQR